MKGGDTFESHIEDTLRTGDGLCNRKIVELVVKEGPDRIRELVDLGLRPDQKDGETDFAIEGGHSHQRIIHIQGDDTGHNVSKVLRETVCAHNRIEVFEHCFVIDLITTDERCRGALVWDSRKRKKVIIEAEDTVIATGGGGRLYRETTNPPVATADGVAFAYRAGCRISDMEFIQFHPTTLYIAGASRSLISETVRGEGAVLRDKNGVHFMPNYHPRGDLAPRDIVSRAIIRQMQLTGDTNVYLDLTHLNAKKIEARFPKLRELCLTFDLDISKDYIPVRPSAHYMVGGIVTDEWARTNIGNLYCCGECAASGLHVANRLGSNSLLEGLVFAHRAAFEIANRAKKRRRIGRRLRAASRLQHPAGGRINFKDVENSLRSLMWRNVGIERDAGGLEEAIKHLNFWCSYVMDKEFNLKDGWLLQDELTTALIISSSALAREETRGTHIRTDFPDRNDKRWKRHQIIERLG